MPALTLLLAATAMPPPYKAVGTEPFWSLTIARDQISYQPAGGRNVRVTTPRAVTIRGGRRYRTAALTVEITRVPCSDGMSDRRYPETVQVRVGRQILRGCGGAATEVAGLEGGKWRITQVNGRALAPTVAATLSFTDGALTGKVCNTLRGSYTLARGILTTAPIAATRMMCPPASMAAERAVISALGQKLYVHQGTDGLVLSDGETSLTLKR
ncbi:META domain-containing protein [Sphingomonas guangdongensis]|uniref:META domain-containing protein n=1 Tax=Sphingomonas guangdongensis TaxID=1141890 RepID=A0A285R0A2_9SPHN|nr:META domain-containing protein [Sphingomonas guangdongensis]SOB87521.1 META domain-containing protein [Sphingomonas guangdongensis]